MANLSKTFEQYCCVKGRNVAVEEITNDDGTKFYKCSMLNDCEECNNKILKYRFKTNHKEKKTD